MIMRAWPIIGHVQLRTLPLFPRDIKQLNDPNESAAGK